MILTPKKIEKSFRDHQIPVPIENITLTQAAVLLAIVEKNNQPSIIFTKRSMKVATHKGQISLPGGSVEPADSSLKETALRETFEEIGLDKQNATVFGYMDGQKTVTDFWITPVVAWVKQPFSYVIDSNEVAYVFEVPIKTLMMPGTLSVEKRIYQGHPYTDYRYTILDNVIWGATGNIIYSFIKTLKKTLKNKN